MSRPTNRRSFIKRAMASTGAGWLVAAGPALLNASEVREGLRIYATWGSANHTPRATARVGQLMLQRGEWNGRQRAWPFGL